MSKMAFTEELGRLLPSGCSEHLWGAFLMP
jgi:hypothetical protein